MTLPIQGDVRTAEDVAGAFAYASSTRGSEKARGHILNGCVPRRCRPVGLPAPAVAGPEPGLSQVHHFVLLCSLSLQNQRFKTEMSLSR